MPVDPVRDAAIDVLLRVFERQYFLGDALDRTLRRKRLSQRGGRFLTQLVYGTARHALLADYVLGPLLHQPFEKLPSAIRAILRMGVFQSLFCNQVTFPAMVDTSVELAKKRDHVGTSRVVNAVLKRVPETLDAIDFPNKAEHPLDYLRVRYSMPAWILEDWEPGYGIEETERICEACATEAPRTARVNTLLNTRDELLEVLGRAKTPAVPHPDVPDAIVFAEGPVPIRGKAFLAGRFFVQDPASMLAPHLLAPEAGQWILDMCAAPGGKTTHLAEITGCGARVVALDTNVRRLDRLLENVERLGVSGIDVVVADGKAPPFKGEFDRVLVDAPCSGFGTLRRHPDLKFRQQPGDLRRLAREQRRLLRSAIGLCKNNGLIVYSVCTFTRVETDRVIGPFLDNKAVTPEDGPEWLEPWKIRPGQYQILPRTGQLDGYFLTRLRKAR